MTLSRAWPVLCILLVGCRTAVLQERVQIPMDSLVATPPPARMSRGEVQLYLRDSAVVIDRTFTARVDKITFDSILFNDGHLLRAGFTDLRSTALQEQETLKVRWKVDHSYFSDFRSVWVTKAPGDSLRLQLVQSGANAPISASIVGITLTQDIAMEDTVSHDKSSQLILRPRSKLVDQNGTKLISLGMPDTVDQGGRKYSITVLQNLHTQPSGSQEGTEHEGPAYHLFHAAWAIP